MSLVILLSVLSLPSLATSLGPNFLLLISEDNSKHHFNIYDKNGVKTPAIASLAEHGLIFDNAFSNTPVCSTARSILATGIYGASYGMHNHRSLVPAALPEDFRPLSLILKQAGYYTSNNAKTDYNFVSDKKLWRQSSNQASWRGRQSDQPFFHVQSFYSTHEHKLHFPLSEQKPLSQPHELPEIYPNTPLFQYTKEKYLHQHTVLDQQIAQVLTKLENDGLLEDTFIFYLSDHGGAMPASKGYLFERGLQVPLIVRIPKNYRHLISIELQTNLPSRLNQFVSFVDIAPTLLALAGLPTETRHQGEAFLTTHSTLEKNNEHKPVFGFADRFDEKIDLVRSVRIGQLKYIRNFQPFYPDGLYNQYRFKQLSYRQWYRMFKQQKLSQKQAAFFQVKSPEALYDLASDPNETVNLANDPVYQKQLAHLRQTLNQQLINMKDLGFYPESYLVMNNFEVPSVPTGSLMNIANLQLISFFDAKPRLVKALQSKQWLKQYWALITLSAFAEQAITLKPLVTNLYRHSQHPLVKGRAIEYLSLIDEFNIEKQLVGIINQSRHPLEQLELLNIAAGITQKKGLFFNRPTNLELPIAVQGTPNYDQNRKLAYWLSARWAFISGEDAIHSYTTQHKIEI